MRRSAGRPAHARACLLTGLLIILSLALSAAAPARAARLLVVCQGGGVVSVVDTSALRVTAEIAVGPGPAAIAVSPDSATAYVTHPDAGRLTRIDTARGAVRDAARIGGQPFGIAVDGDGTLYVSDWSADAVRRLDPGTFGITGVVKVGRAPAGLALDRRRRELYSADREAGTLSIIDLATFTRSAALPVGDGPYAFDTSDDPHTLWLVNARGGDLVGLRKATRTLTRVPVGKMPYGVASDPDSGRVLVANQQSGTLSLIASDPATAPRTLRVGGSPEGVRIDPAGPIAYVVDWFSDAVLVIDLDTFSVRTRIPVGKGPRALVLVP